MIDLTPLAQFVAGIAAACAVPTAGFLAQRALSVAQTRLHLTLSRQDQAAIQNAVNAGAGIIRAKLASGTVSLSDLTTGNPHIDNAAQFAVNLIDATVDQPTVNRQQVADSIIAMIGHYLGDDPGVPSVAAAPAAVTVPAAAPA